jgi:hypothetical protein
MPSLWNNVCVLLQQCAAGLVTVKYVDVTAWKEGKLKSETHVSVYKYT